MIEEGIVRLVQADSGVLAIAPVGGFFTELPKDLTLPSWSYRLVGGAVSHTLQGARGPRAVRLQIDCYGANTGNGADAIGLAAAIDAVLDGFTGALSDPDATVVDSCLLEEEPMDFFDDAGRTYRRMLEYHLIYFQ